MEFNLDMNDRIDYSTYDDFRRRSSWINRERSDNDGGKFVNFDCFDDSNIYSNEDVPSLLDVYPFNGVENKQEFGTVIDTRPKSFEDPSPNEEEPIDLSNIYTTYEPKIVKEQVINGNINLDEISNIDLPSCFSYDDLKEFLTYEQTEVLCRYCENYNPLLDCFYDKSNNTYFCKKCSVNDNITNDYLSRCSWELESNKIKDGYEKCARCNKCKPLSSYIQRNKMTGKMKNILHIKERVFKKSRNCIYCRNRKSYEYFQRKKNVIEKLKMCV